MHEQAFRALGAEVSNAHGYLIAEAKAARLVGGDLAFRQPSVGATKNALLAAVFADGTTTLRNVAMEPETEMPRVDDAFVSEPSTAHGGAIAAAIVSEYAVPARSAESKSDTTSDGRGVRGARAMRPTTNGSPRYANYSRSVRIRATTVPARRRCTPPRGVDRSRSSKR